MANESLMERYDAASGLLGRVLRRFLDEPVAATIEREAREEFATLADEMPYADRPDHSMFSSALGVFQWLAVYLAAQRHEVTAHDLGAALLAERFPSFPGTLTEKAREKLARDAAESQRSAAENEFEFAFRASEDDPEKSYSIDITRCAVCHAFGRHDAMEFVPYMCATDDLVSEAGDQGLRRTGTIALGAHRCDFRYEHGGEPLPLAPQYPDRIRTGDRDA